LPFRLRITFRAVFISASLSLKPSEREESMTSYDSVEVYLPLRSAWDPKIEIRNQESYFHGWYPEPLPVA
jgi:hypothetical protein